MMHWPASAAFVAPLLIGGDSPCPEPNTPDIRNCPFPVEPGSSAGVVLVQVVPRGRHAVSKGCGSLSR